VKHWVVRMRTQTVRRARLPAVYANSAVEGLIKRMNGYRTTSAGGSRCSCPELDG
jgi:hypothetical protein